MSDIQIATPRELITKIKDEAQIIRDDLNTGTGYAGPDPRAEETIRGQERLKALQDVLKWIEEAEAQRVAAAVRKAIHQH